MESPISPVFSASLWIILEKGTVKDRRKTVVVRWGKAHQRVLRYLKVTNICENGEKSSKQITCCNDQKSTVARKGKSPALQRGLMNIGAGLGIEDCFYHVDINLICLVWWKMYPLLYPQSLLLRKRNQTRKLGDEVKRGTHILVHFSMCYPWFLLFLLLYTHSAINCSAGSGGA